MDGLSSAASGMAVVSLAVQVADGLWKLNKFFESIKDAPDEIQRFSTELDLLAQIIRRLAPDEGVHREVLENVKSKVENLQEIVAKLEPGLKADKKSARRLAALKAVAAGGRIRTFRASLEETKSSLMLGLLATTLAVQHKHSQQLANGNVIDARNITTIIMESVRNELKVVKGGAGSDDELQQGYTSQTIVTETTTEVGYHKASLLKEVDDMASRITNPVIRNGFRAEMHSTIEMQFSKLRRVKSDGRIKHKQPNPTTSTVEPDPTTTDPKPPSPPPPIQRRAADISSVKADPPPRTVYRVLVDVKQYSMDHFFGKVVVLTEVWQVTSPSRWGRNTVDTVEWSTQFHFYPAAWLFQCSLAYGCSLRISRTQKGWVQQFEPFRAVPDDSLVFDMAYSGNLEALEIMFHRGKASVHDTDSRGWTPLAWAAYGMHTPTIRWLIDHGADESGTVRSHRDKHQTNDYTILELAAGSRGVTHGGRPIGTRLSPRLQAEDLFGTWIDDVSFETDGIGWDLINSLIGSCYRQLGLPSLKAAVIWIFTKYRDEIERGIRLEPRRLRDMYHRALWAGRGDIVDIVASYFGLAQDHPSFEGFGCLERLVWRMIGEVEEVRITGIVEAVQRTLLNGVNPHLAGREPYFSPHLETVLSIALYTPGAFWHWRNILRCLNVDPAAYFEEELRHASRLTLLGWTKEALLAVWNFDYSASFFNERSTCRQCNTYFYFSWGKWWEQEVLRRARETNQVPTGDDEDPEWKLFMGWTPELRDAYFKGWIQMKSSDAGIEYAKFMGSRRGDEQQKASRNRAPSTATSSDSSAGSQMTPLSSSSGSDSSSGAPLGVPLRTPSHSSGSGLDDDASQDGKSGTGGSASDIVEIPTQPRIWWNYRPNEEQLCQACRTAYMAQQMERLSLGTDASHLWMPGSFPE